MIRYKKFISIIIVALIFLSLGQPTIAGAIESEKPKTVIVLIDPGHAPGNGNSGPTGYYEYEGMWKLANYLKKSLVRCGIEVELTREEEEDPSLSDRGSKAKGKDLFISLHSNAAGSEEANGCEVYYSVQQEENRKHAEELAKVGSEVMENNNRGAKTRNSNDHPGEDYFGVIRAAVAAECPYVFLVESGFHTNLKDESFLKDDNDLNRLAESYAQVLCDILDVEFKEEPVESKVGWVLDNGNWYYYNEYGTMATGWIKLGDTWYYLYDSGAMATGWIKLGGTWYYLYDSGAMATGWIKLGDTWYYLYDSGAMATGWIKLGDTWYYLYDSGAMATGWIKLGGTWYYLYDSGAMATGWVKLGGTWYYLYDSGAMATGWIKPGGTWYYLYGSGAMATGWINLGGTWYYLYGSGDMATGWINLGGTWYYLYGSGDMASNTTVGGYKLGGNGAWIP